MTNPNEQYPGISYRLVSHTRQTRIKGCISSRILAPNAHQHSHCSVSIKQKGVYKVSQGFAKDGPY